MDSADGTLVKCKVYMETMELTQEQAVVWEVLNARTDIPHIEYRMRFGLTWLTKNREILRIDRMDTDHIIKCVNMLERAGQEKTRAYDGLIAEIKKRIESGEEYDSWMG